MVERYGRPAADDRSRVEQLLFTLTSFETFDTLAGPRRSLNDVGPLIEQVARAAIGLRPP